MLRFCDSKVIDVEYNLVDRGALMSYFCSGHLDEIVCVYNKSIIKKFIGVITYYDLSHTDTVEEAIRKEYVFLDNDIWQNAREIYKKRSRDTWENILLPVINKEYQLICFAYQDEDANREVRMLRELSEIALGGGLQFSDVFGGGYKCIIMHGFNELAFLFTEYLRTQNILVQVEGEMWQSFYENEECKVPEYECLHIYAEGTWEKARNWRENLLRSVSVEFECIDKIYEENLKNNLIPDVGEGVYKLMERLRNEEEVILFGRGKKAQDAYDFLIGNGVEICCFAVVDLLPDRYRHNLFGKKILHIIEVMRKYQNPIFVDCGMKHSAWGLGQVDYFDYIGYRRNESFFMLGDYTEVPENNLLNTFRNANVFFTGNKFLCGRLYEYLKEKNVSVMGYLQIFQDDLQMSNMPEVQINAINEDNVCVIIEPSFYSYGKKTIVGMEKLPQCMEYLKGKNICNFTEYFSDISSFVKVESNTNIKYRKNFLLPKRVILGSIELLNGNLFFRALLDSHPSIIMFMNYSELNERLFEICVCLSMENAENILPLFWKLIEKNKECITDKSAFDKKMEQLLAYGTKFTSQELFVMIHISYAHMLGRNVSDDNIRNMVIYWEPHFQNRNTVEKYREWLMAKEMPCDIINIVRNSVPQKGTGLKAWGLVGGVRGAYSSVFRQLAIRKSVGDVGRAIFKFEDLKCNPRDILQTICHLWGIAWSDTLMHCTRGGKEYVYSDDSQTVKDFDLRPVYNTYENFFSEFDRVRIMIIDALYQKEYGYPFVEPGQFTRRELQEMFLKEFRFENPGDTTGFYKGHLNLDERIKLQDDLRRRLQETRCQLSTN